MLNTVYLILFLPLPAHAGTIINRPLAIGLNQGLVGHWTFDQKDMKSNNLAYDVSGQGNTGTLTNGPVRAIGRIGQALNFDGVDDRVGVGSGASRGSGWGLRHRGDLAGVQSLDGRLRQ